MNTLFWALAVCMTLEGTAIAQDKMIITTKDGKIQSFDTNAIQKIEFQSGLPSGAAIAPSLPAQTRTAVLQSYNYPTHFIRHANFSGEISPLVNDLDRRDGTFRIVPGLADSRYVSFESTNYPGYYLRHQNFRVQLHKPDGSQLFREDATFKMKPGLADASWSSFESANYAGHYLRHRNFHLYIEQGADDLFRKDATFKLVAPPW
ncbi:MAG: AbfB domain-containing protein [Nitrospirota bacterium]